MVLSKLLVIDGLSETCMCKHCEMDPSKERESAGAWPGARARSMPGGDSHLILNLFVINPQTGLGYICSPDVTNVSHAGPGRHAGELRLVALRGPAPGLQLHPRKRLRAATWCAVSCVAILTPHV